MFAMAQCHFTLSEGQSCEIWEKTHIGWRPLHYGVCLSGSQHLDASLRTLHRNNSAEIYPSQVSIKREKAVPLSVKF